MSNAPMLYVFQESEYQSRCQEAKLRYEGNIESPVTSVKGAIVELVPASLEAAFEAYHDYRTEGFTVFDAMSPLPSVNIVHSPVTGSLVTLYMLKPQEQQEADLEIIFAQVRSDYESELECKLESEVERQVQMVLAKQDRDSQLAAEQDRLKREQVVRDELAASREKLRAELIASGKLNADGSAE